MQPSADVTCGRVSFACLWLSVTGFLVLSAALINPAAAALPSGLQNLVDNATGGSAPAASAAQAASTPTLASQAELARSLDSLIGTLESDPERKALVAQLKGLRAGTQSAAPVVPASSAQDNSDLLGAIASGIASVETDLSEGRTPLHYWAARSRAAANDLGTIFRGASGESFGNVLLGLIGTLAGWAACAGLLIYLGRSVSARYGWKVTLEPSPTSFELLNFAFWRTAPWIVAFVAVALFMRGMPDALGSTLGLVIVYTIVAGSIFSALCLIVFSVFNTAHRRVAVHQLLAQSRWPLFAIGACGALGDATANPDVTGLLGVNLAGLVSASANVAAAVLIGYFAIAYRRPVTHLIRNRPYAGRRDHKLATEALDILASLWHIPILLIAIASVVAIIDARGSEENVLQPSLLSALLLVLTLFVSALLMHLTRRRDTRAHRRAPHLMRLLRFASTLLVLLMWLAFIQFELDLWSGPIARMIKHGTMTPSFKHALVTVIATVFCAWFIWILCDTAILNALGPSSSRNKALDPGVRARTMLPLVRNAVSVTVVTLAAIVAAATLGVNLTPLLAGAGVIGLAVGFGAKALVTDLITGLFIIIEETISVGDWIEIDGSHAGAVMDLTIRTVRLRDGQGAVHTIPFSQIKIVKNLSRDFANAVFEVRVPFAVELDDVTRMIVEVGADLQEDFRLRNEILAPVEVWGLDRFEANWMVVKGQIKTRPLQQWSVARAFNARLKRKMDEAGIEIPVPHMRLHTPANGPNAWSQSDEDAEDDSGQTNDANNEAARSPARTVPVEPRVLKEPPATQPVVQTGSRSSINSPGSDTGRL
ncbi:mechanosensitive ion channel family protein [Paraburkholderia sp. BL25I1N1]|uniref:mechanosensitive ion channel family protein n=1 Tax=Paraburkholderia sp. BL25I1N1 TaxID=1938804 RepID=UPI000D066C41|nr:mechanosensitive ion channel family protein [Paraburkholderia sp. BL25I1N1]PRY08493.1 small-conductance mechanosensitive channel [Paraburkholderia sp. BL25I1N1]